MTSAHRPKVASPSVSPGVPDERVDGRRARGERNKDAVVTALLELYGQGEFQPSAARIAVLAGVSERSVFRYFDDMEDLAATAVAIQWERVQPFYSNLSTQGSFEERLEAIVSHRLDLYDKVGRVFRVALAAAMRLSAAADAVEQRRDFLRRQSRKQFQGEIDSQPKASNVAVIVDFTLSLENIHYLRQSLGLNDALIKDVLSDSLRSVLLPSA